MKVTHQPAAPADPAATGGRDPQSVLRQFRIVFKSVRQHYDIVEKRCGLSGAQLSALAMVHRRPGLKVTDLARHLSIHQTTASNLVRLLLEKALVERHRSAEDGRIVELFVTTAGQRVIQKAPQPLEGVLPDALNHLSMESLERLGIALADLLEVMKIRVDAGAHTPLSDI
jgi:DNA-binding MarR family transcriptional regulator